MQKHSKTILIFSMPANTYRSYCNVADTLFFLRILFEKLPVKFKRFFFNFDSSNLAQWFVLKAKTADRPLRNVYRIHCIFFNDCYEFWKKKLSDTGQIIYLFYKLNGKRRYLLFMNLLPPNLYCSLFLLSCLKFIEASLIKARWNAILRA